MTELQNDGITELQKDRQGKSSIAPTFQSGAIIITNYKGSVETDNIVLGKRDVEATNIELRHHSRERFLKQLSLSKISNMI